jgi:hypothetical protein
MLLLALWATALPAPWEPWAEAGELGAVDGKTLGLVGERYNPLSGKAATGFSFSLRREGGRLYVDFGEQPLARQVYAERWPVEKAEVKGGELLLTVEDPWAWAPYMCGLPAGSSPGTLRLSAPKSRTFTLTTCNRSRTLHLGGSLDQRFARWQEDQAWRILAAAGLPRDAKGGATHEGQRVSGCRLVLEGCDPKRKVARCETSGGAVLYARAKKHDRWLAGPAAAQTWCPGLPLLSFPL